MMVLRKSGIDNSNGHIIVDVLNTDDEYCQFKSCNQLSELASTPQDDKKGGLIA